MNSLFDRFKEYVKEDFEKEFDKFNNPALSKDELKTLYSLLDLTSLNSTDTSTHIQQFVEQVNKPSDIGNVAAICVYPNHVETVRKALKIDGINVASVGACFPSSMSMLDIKLQEVRAILEAGADELDIVLPLWAFLAGDYEYCRKEVREIKRLMTGGQHLKVILEASLLTDAESVWKASVLAMESGADFIKTSTGKEGSIAQPKDAYVMCSAIRAFNDTNSKTIGFKPAGGISTIETATTYYRLVENKLGKPWLSSKLFRIGASRLASTIMKEYHNN
ncbi:MAG: deoxyribose-phosphate aldolase [Bacteroidales bacterium]